MTPVKAVHAWSLFRTMGRFVAPGSMPSGAMAEGGQPHLSVLELPGELARHGFGSAQLCHFYLPSRDAGFLGELRGAFAAADVELECFLIDDGDLTEPRHGGDAADWISGWLETAEQLGARRARVIAGKQAPSPDTLRLSADRLLALAARHEAVRIVTENWHALLPDAAAVLELLDRTQGRVGFLVDLGNWSGPGKYDELAAVAGRAETCQAKVRTLEDGSIDEDDFRACLGVLRTAGYAGPLALVHDGPRPDEWDQLDRAYALACGVFGDPPG